MLAADSLLLLATVVWGSPPFLPQSEPASASVQTRSPVQQRVPQAIGPHRVEGPEAADRRPDHRPVQPQAELAGGAAPVDTISYETQPGDTLLAVAHRFGVSPMELRQWNDLQAADQALLAPGSALHVAAPSRSAEAQPWLLPDSELVYSPGAVDLDVAELAGAWDGYLRQYRERVEGEWLQGPEVVLRAALDHSINPRLLLAILEMRSGWLRNPELPRGRGLTYPIWPADSRLQGRYLQLSWAANELSHAYYGWRAGTYLEVPLRDGASLPMAPSSNAASVAVMHLSARFAARTRADPHVVAGELLQVYADLFGDPWQYQVALFDAATAQPPLALPFPADNPWVFTGGPHGAWGTESAWAALDFAPKWDRRARRSNKELVALADGVVARLEDGVLVLDLDGDGHEQTGWSVLYLHVVPEEHIVLGSVLQQGEPIGVAAEIGGVSHGLHVHIARKYNGEWLAADGPLPFELDGWQVRAGAESYLGVLYRDGSELLACPYASQTLLSVGGGEMLPQPQLPENLRGCWSMPGRQPAQVTAAVDPLEPWLYALDPGPVDIPPTHVLSAPY